MADMIIIIDFAGTLIKAEMIEEANKIRSEILQRSLPTKEEHADPESLYKANREYVERLTGLRQEHKILYRENNLDFMMMSGKEMQNQMSTNLFQYGMYMVANKHGRDIVPEGLIDQLQRIKDLGYRLAIVSGVRTDIISGMLQIAQVPVEFSIYGQPPMLGHDQMKDLHDLSKQGTIEYSMGDKFSDLERAKAFGAKTIYTRWGHPVGGEENIADYVIAKPADLERIIT